MTTQAFIVKTTVMFLDSKLTNPCKTFFFCRLDLLSDSMKQDAASAAERLKQHDASSDNDKNAESELEALTHKGARR